MNLTGWVLNSNAGVFIEAQGEPELLEKFLLRLQSEKPARSFIQSLEFSYLDPIGFDGFTIRASESGGAPNTLVLPDIATCPDCLSDILDPKNRRFRYPFTNCTNCGPRFTIVESLPYDRARTSMKRFEMCAECRREYESPLDRRFHAQPNACPTCGPKLELWSPSGAILAHEDEALLRASAAVSAGQILALKGLGGFHLIVDARNDEAVRRLRLRKHREEKPFALLYPGLESVRADCRVSALEERLLGSPEAPIVLLERLESGARTAPSTAPGNPYSGVMLPYTPLHHLFMRELGFPVVATSGNLSDEPICIDENEAVGRLGSIADLFLVHNRPIVRHVDDSIARIMMNRELVLRRARGYAPLPLSIGAPAPTLLAVGAHLKNTIALSVRDQIFISQHIGDLETPEASDAFRNAIDSFRRLYDVQPEAVVADLHPDYLSTAYARNLGLPLISVQHHYAHIRACMAENELSGPVLGISWDGTGYGTDGTIWGGESLVVDGASFRRVGCLRNFPLPGGAQAIKEPRRSALGVLYEMQGDSIFERDDLENMKAFNLSELAVLRRMLGNSINSPRTSSAGRLFDAAAALAGLQQKSNFEGQAAMALEFAAATEDSKSGIYPFVLNSIRDQDAQEFYIVDWAPAIDELLRDVKRKEAITSISGRFHRGLAESIVAVARRIGLEQVALSGGCFQNRLLTEATIRSLQAAGFRPYWHQRIPPNDGGISLGQIAAALAARQGER
jgi:hydrogenase maturation protein HypF